MKIKDLLACSVQLVIVQISRIQVHMSLAEFLLLLTHTHRKRELQKKKIKALMFVQNRVKMLHWFKSEN